MTKQVSLSDRIQKAEELFKEYLPEKVSDLEKAWHHLRFVQWSTKPLEDMTRIAHTLAGSAATLRHTDLTKTFKELDSTLIHFAEMGGVPSSELCQTVEQLLQTIKKQSAEVQTSKSLSLLAFDEDVPVLRDALKELIYLVDDDPIVLQVLGAQLKQAGFTVKTFSSLPDLYVELKSETPSLVILDIVFPQSALAGVEALQSLRVKTGFQIPVIFISARSDIVARLKALRSGGHAYFTKPIDIKLLVQTCHNLTKAGEEKYRVLLVDDDQVCLLMHETFLQGANFAVRSVSDPLQVLQEIHNFKPDLLVLDLKMPDCDGIEVAQILRQEKEFMFLPIIFLSGTEDPEEQKKMDSLENCEFMSKPIERDDLVNKALQHSREYQYLQNKLIELRGAESATNIVSRYEFIGRLDEKLSSTAVDTHPCTLIYLVLDELDDIRKTKGLRSQGEVNSQLFKLLVGDLEQNDVVAGQADGIFMVLKYGHAASVQAYTDKLLPRLKSYSVDCSGVVISARSSLGVLPLLPDMTGAHDAIAEAEKLAAKALKNGGNRVSIAEAKLVEQPINKAGEDPQSEDALHEAIREKRFTLKFQPIVNVSDPAYDAFEVLLRLRSKTGKEFLPEHFLPYFEERRELKALDRWVYATAMESLKHDQNARHNSMLFLKVSKETISNNLIAPLVSNFLREGRIKGDGRIVFMLKQKDILGNLDQSVVFAEKIRAIGCKIGVENFTQEESKPYFNRLYPDVLKLGKAMIEQAREDDKMQKNMRTFVKSMSERHVDIVVPEVESVVDMQQFYKWGINLFLGYAIQVPGDSLQRNFAFEGDEE